MNDAPSPPGVRCELAAIGTSWGGLDALTLLLSRLPASLRYPMLVVQHRGIEARDNMVSHLQRVTGLKLCEADDKMPLLPGHVYFGPANYHLAVAKGRVSLSVDGPVNHARPAIDVLFESVAFAHGPGAVGVVLTGASADGAQGLRTIRQRGGLAVVQDPATAAMQVMPAAAVRVAAPQHVLPLEGIAQLLARLS